MILVTVSAGRSRAEPMFHETTDEMCILFGTWYVVNEGDNISQQGCFGF